MENLYRLYSKHKLYLANDDNLEIKGAYKFEYIDYIISKNTITEEDMSNRLR